MIESRFFLLGVRVVGSGGRQKKRYRSTQYCGVTVFFVFHKWDPSISHAHTNNLLVTLLCGKINKNCYEKREKARETSERRSACAEKKHKIPNLVIRSGLPNPIVQMLPEMSYLVQVRRT